MASVTEMPPAEAVETPFDEPQSQTPTPKSEKKKGGRPPNSAKREAEAKSPAFFERVSRVPAEDWGTRAFIYLYIDEPVCVAKTWGQTRYAKKLHSPVLDLEPLKEMYGSFKGWMSLNLRKTGKDATDQVDRLDFEIFDPLCPPKIPRAAWANDDKNRRWEALMPPLPKPQTEGASNLLDSIKVYKEIVADVKEEMDPGEVEEPADRTRETLETMKLAKELFATPAAAPSEGSPLKTAVELFTIMNQMKAENPAIELYRDELKAMREELKAEREAARKPTATTGGTFMEQVAAFIPLWTQVEPLAKRLLGVNGTTAVSATVEPSRPAKMGALDFLAEVLPKVFDSPIANAIAHKVMQSVEQPPQNAGMNGQQQPQQRPQVQQPQQPRGDPFELWITIAGTPGMMEHFMAGESGSSFAEWVWFGRPDYLPRLQQFKHPLMPNVQAGLESIVQAYKNTDTVWPDILKRGEPAFRQFIGEFCSWVEPKEAEEPETANEDEDGWATRAAQQTQGDSGRGERVS